MPNYPGGLVDDLAAMVGDDLRSVASYDRGEYDMHHIRADIEAEYSEAEIAEVYNQVEIEGMGYDHFENLFHTGLMKCAIYGFEKALMFHFPNDPFSGLFVSVDRDSELDIDSVIETCTSAID